MIEVDVTVLPDGVRKRARIDPNVSLDKNKQDLIAVLDRAGFEVGESEEYSVAITPSELSKSLRNYTPSDGDRVWLIRTEFAAGESAELLPDND